MRDSPFGGAGLEATPWILEENLEEDPSREVTAVVHGSELERFLTWDADPTSTGRRSC